MSDQIERKPEGGMREILERRIIPHLKITDRGLVDVDRFELIDP